MNHRFRKRPVVIEAVQVERLNEEGAPNWIFNAQFRAPEIPGAIYKNNEGQLVIHTLEGHMKVSPGDWIIRGVAGEIYPCKNDIFLATYEEA